MTHIDFVSILVFQSRTKAMVADDIVVEIVRVVSGYWFDAFPWYNEMLMNEKYCWMSADLERLFPEKKIQNNVWFIIKIILTIAS